MGRKLDPDLTPDKEFKDLDKDNNQSLTVDEFAAGFTNFWLIGAIIVATLVVPFVLGYYICKSMRLPEYSTRMGFVLLAITASAVILYFGQLRKGIDLSGGVILVYAVDQDKTREMSADGMDAEGDYMDRLIAALNLRVNPGGQKEIVIRRFGENEVEIIVPEAQPAEIEQLKKTIRTAGFLEFRIMANDRNLSKFLRGDTDKLLEDAQKSESPRDVQIEITDPTTKQPVMLTVARWMPIDPDQINLERDFTPPLIKRKNAEGQDEVLAIVRDPFREREWVVRGNELRSAGQSRDSNTGQIAVSFNMTSVGGSNLGEMTGEFSPEDGGNFNHRMGIIFDGKLISAPGLKSVISDSGQITGNYTKQEVSSMVNILNAGSLPAVLIESPVSQNEIGATVGEDTIQKGSLAMVVSTGIVLLFMAAFYRFCGLVACGALLLNIAITFAVIVLVKAPLTLPGLAGLALGVGMAVDANVLIFERIREELDRGAALRMAIRNGFDRATTTIIDSNLTTVITAVILYWIGTDQVKGFAVTLIIGITANLFTAITCSRLVFDIADKKRLLTKLTMSRLIEGTKFDFIGKQQLCIAGSTILIVIGLVAVYTRGITLLDIDFAGGTSADLVFNEEKNVEDLRKELDDSGILDATVSKIERQDGKDIQFKVDTSLGNPSSLPIEFAKRDKNQDGKLDLTEYTDGRKDRSAAFAATRFAELDKNQDKFVDNEKEFAISREDVLYFYLEGIFGDKLRRNALTFSPPAAVETKSTSSTSASRSNDLAELKPADAAPAREPRAISAPAISAARKPRIRLASYQAEGEAAPTQEGDSNPAETPAAGQPPVEDLAPAAPEKPTDSPPADAKPADAKPADTAAATEQPQSPPTSPTDPAPSVPAPSVPAPAEPAKAEPATADPAKADPAKSAPESTTATSPSPRTTSVRGMQSSTTLTFAEKVSYKEVQGTLQLLVQEKFPGAQFRVIHAENPGSQEASTDWVFESSLPAADSKALLDGYAAKLAGEPVFPAASSIGPQVAGKSQQQAVLAIILSLLAIIVYVWIRFQKVVYGVAAVIALAHDVLVTLGFIALSSYFVNAVPGLAEVLQIDAFKINLTVVAAFLTIIGFSINDTIVIFDRVREVRGKSPHLTKEMVNLSVNQTLGRTFLTSFTVLTVVVILYFFGGEAIHGFAFAMLVGLISGVYSTVFIANPIVLYLSQKAEPAKSPVRAPAQVA